MARVCLVSRWTVVAYRDGSKENIKERQSMYVESISGFILLF